VDIAKYREKDIKTIENEALLAVKNRATGFCLVTAGKGLDEKKLEFVCSVAKKIKKILPSLSLIACNGTASIEQLKELKNAGIDSYNHNLETSKEFYPQICTTHTWQERFETCLNIKRVGLKLCSGGIFGLGESKEDRNSFVNSLKELKPNSTPINFFHPNPKLPLSQDILDVDEALELVSFVKDALPDTRIMVAGGREITLGERWSEIFEKGADSIVIGNYLTTKGDEPDKDIKTIESLGYEIASSCD
jgi:biotin synthase